MYYINRYDSNMKVRLVNTNDFSFVTIIIIIQRTVKVNIKTCFFKINLIFQSYFQLKSQE